MASRRILLIFAHPDDESFAAAGVARRYADEGAEVALVCATRGDAGKIGDPPVCSKEDLPACREAEMHKAAEILGIRHLHFLDYLDKHLSDAPPAKIREELVGLIRLHRPHIVISFDPNGGNGHLDHRAIARFAVDAVTAAADARWHTNLGAAHRVPRVLWTPPLRPWDVPKSADRNNEPGVDFLVDTSRYLKVKIDALRAHRTQHESIDRLLFTLPNVEEILSVEAFRQAWGPPVTNIPGDDVFAGIDD